MIDATGSPDGGEETEDARDVYIYGCVPNSTERMHWFACVSHFFMSVAILAIAILKGADRCAPVTISFATGRPGAFANTSSSMQIGGPGICFAWLAFAFEVVCFLAHLRVLWRATESGFAYNYENYLQRILQTRVNPWRWNEYALSSSIMILAIASVVGLHDLGALLCLAAANVGTMYTGQWSEESNAATLSKREQSKCCGCGRPAKRGKFKPFLVGVVLQTFVWISVFVSYGHTVQRVGGVDAVPWFVHLFAFFLFAAFSSFAIVELLWTAGVIRLYTTKEWWYVALSLGSKIGLAAQVAGAALQ